MSEIKVNSIKGVSASTAAISIDNSSGTCTANITNNLSNRNLIINGAMQVAQRGTSSTVDGFATLDRFKTASSGTDELPTQAQADVAAGTTPYTLGFRKCFKLTNGNQTSGAGASDKIEIQTMLEAKDIANSGWNYLSASSYITLSFWIKSSVAQAFFVRLQTRDGTAQRYKTSTGSLSADTWTKVTKKIPGNSNLQFDDDHNAGLRISFYAFAGTDYSDSSATETWAASATGNRTSDMTSTWYTTNNATLRITGVQLEVGSVATDFEHRSYAQELALCKRYFQMSFTDNPGTANTSNDGVILWGGSATSSTTSFIGGCFIQHVPSMRATPTVTIFDLASPRNTGKCHRHTYGIAGQNNQDATVTDTNINGFIMRSGGTHGGTGIVFHYKVEAEL